MAEKKKQRRYLKGCAMPIVVFITIVAAIFLYLSMKTGGYEGVKRWIANKALSGVEASILKKLPTGISAEQVKLEFDAIKKANRQRNVDLEKLNEALLKYQRKVGKAPPSAKQVEELFSGMRGAIIAESDG